MRHSLRLPNIYTYYSCQLLLTSSGGKAQLTANITAALPFMDEDMKELAGRTLSKVDALTDAEFSELAAFAADEV